MQLLGWADAIFPANGALRALQNLSVRDIPVWSYFGTGGHSEPINFNETLFTLAFITSWFDHWFKGTPLDLATEPYVVFADNRPGWPHRATIGWPPQPQGGTRLFLAASTLRTTPAVTNSETPFTLTYDPAYTPARGWTDGYQGTAFRQAFRSTPARFLSAPLVDTLDITGIPRALLQLRSSSTHYQAHVRIVDVAPSDTGFIWSVLTRGTSGVVAPVAGAALSRLIDCEAMSHHVVPGHRIGVEVTSLDMFDSERAHIVPYFAASSATLLSGPEALSYVDLPLIGTAKFTSVATAMNEAPGEFALDQNYPNPFNGNAEIGFAIAEFSDVKLQVYDLLGRLVTTLVNERKAPGRYAVRFEAGGLASGTYVYRLTADGRSIARRMALIR
jgi:predicted acyl esterase